MENDCFIIEEQLINTINMAENIRENSVDKANKILLAISSLKDLILIDNKTIDIGQTEIINNMNIINKNLNGLSNTLNFTIRMYDKSIVNAVNNLNSKIGE